MKKIFLKKIIQILEFIESAPYKVRYFAYKKLHHLPNDFRFNGPRTKIYGEGRLVIGAQSYCGEGCSFQLKKGSKISIGSNCSISHNVRIYTANKDPLFIIIGAERNIHSGSVLIGNNVWIGANVFINKGIKIGSNSIVGANSVVTKDIPDNSVYGGVPAKLLYKV